MPPGLPLATGVTGDLAYANLTPAAEGAKLLGRGDGGAGDWQEITLGTGLEMEGTTLSATGGGGEGGTPVHYVAMFTAQTTVSYSWHDA